MKYLIKMLNFSKKYQNEVVSINDIFITNRITLLLGKNGSGKSTLLKAIGGLIKYEGSIDLIGKVSYMSEITSFPDDLTVSEFIYSLSNLSKASVHEKEIEYLFNNFNMMNKKNELLSSLSKGMKAKVNLIQVLIEQSDIYLLDEPINGLDKDGIVCLINYLAKSENAFIISTHIIDDFKKLKSEVIKI